MLIKARFVFFLICRLNCVDLFNFLVSFITIFKNLFLIIYETFIICDFTKNIYVVVQKIANRICIEFFCGLKLKTKNYFEKFYQSFVRSLGLMLYTHMQLLGQFNLLLCNWHLSLFCPYEIPSWLIRRGGRVVKALDC